MKNFNLLVSTPRYNEREAKAELWFTLLMCKDTYPIISGIYFPGLITALTNLNTNKVINEIKKILKKNPSFFQFILKIVPINFICETNTRTIKYMIQENYENFINKEDTFRITLKRRHHEKIDRINFIETIAKDINNKVNLDNPDKTIRIEILGNICGISFLEKNDIIKVRKLRFD
ncbi:MAG: THUMP domain-containing protein [Candidatus Lokiarchaeota archaeon]|nr:THUMP domain-containing protein [Candidatus Lokiarchaeota archaeon]MCK4479794.1 THUMP domain-containing protein [Candidatus Lokiarchaeota archaeon]